MEAIQHTAEQISHKIENVETREMNKQDWKNIALMGLPIVAIVSP